MRRAIGSFLVSCGVVFGAGCSEEDCREAGCECLNDSDCDSGSCYMRYENQGECEEDFGRGGTGGASTGGTGGSEPCVSGGTCRCDDEQYGHVKCTDDGVPECDCTLCPNVMPVEPGTFEACGGEPFGTWRLTDFNSAQTTIALSYTDAGGTQHEGSCPVEVVEQSETFDFLMNFIDAGDFEILAGPFDYTLLLSSECTEPTVGVACTTFGPCRNADCGNCECDFGLSETQVMEGSWSREETELSIGNNTGTVTYDYCVEGDVMRLHVEGKFYTLERVYTVGRPVPCEERTDETCTAGDHCRFGVCVGGENCAEATTEANCTNRAGCSWDPSVCVGSRRYSCSLDEYGHVPDCDIIVAPATCVGTVSRCSVNDPGSCRQTPGCTVGTAGCRGGDVACSALDCGVCEATGCTCPMLTCTGMTSCEAQSSTSDCELFPECEWVEQLCEGTPTPCAMLDPSTCSLVDGCRVEPG